jgi:hypothetical protein
VKARGGKELRSPSFLLCFFPAASVGAIYHLALYTAARACHADVIVCTCVYVNKCFLQKAFRGRR